MLARLELVSNGRPPVAYTRRHRTHHDLQPQESLGWDHGIGHRSCRALRAGRQRTRRPAGSRSAHSGRCGLNLGPEYSSLEDAGFSPRYRARCCCGAVAYEAGADPVDAKICHCGECRTLHGAPMQWAAIFRKKDIRLTSGFDRLTFYNSTLNRRDRVLPCKVACAFCGTLIADEGRTMWLAFPTLFEFGTPPKVPATFRPSCHIFYAMRVMDVDDGLPKWSGHKGHSRRL